MIEADRYAFVSASSSGLLLDLQSGALFRLNESASFVWQLLLTGRQDAEIAVALASRYGIAGDRARTDVAIALELAGGSGAPAPKDDFVYEPSATGYVQSFRGRPVLEVDARGEHLRAIAPVSERRPRHLGNCLRAITPKVLSLRGHVVIHASAAVVAGRLLAFVGPSGAGKTTTARALVDRGATPVCEDKLLVRIDGDQVKAWSFGEPSVEDWVTRATIALLADGESPCGPLDEAVAGEQTPVVEVGFIDAGRRLNCALVARPIGQLDAAAEMFHHVFLGSEAPRHWRRHLDLSLAIVASVPSYELTMPSDLQALAGAAARLIARGTLRA